MKTFVKVLPLERVRASLLAVAVGELSTRVPAPLRALDTALGGAIKRVLSTGDFTGAADQTTMLYPKRGSTRVLLIGMGKPKEITRGAIRRAAAVATRTAIGVGAETVAFHVVATALGGVPAAVLGQVSVEGAGQGAWRFNELRAVADEKPPVRRFEIIATAETRRDMGRGRRVGQALAVGQKLARNLQMLPANVCTPSYLAQIARDLGTAYGFRVTVLNRAQIQKAGLNALLAVAQGSQEDPRFIVIEYRGADRAAPVCLVGKGVTFDSGGISIKPALNMEEMKYDMSGAAAVLGTFEALGQLQPEINVVGLVPATENLPSGTATRPGDVVHGHLGKTIEVVNTDAEGRLILCDALSYARKFKPQCVIDAATLTGAIVIGLGHHATGVMGNDDQLTEEVLAAGARAGERCWPLPLWDEYRDQIKSDIADVKNTGGRAAGSITAGWFLREFVDGFPWAHLDIAGTAYTDSAHPHMAKGPTGCGVRLFAEFVLGRAGR